MRPLALAGGEHPSTIFSHLVAEHSNGRGILGFLTTRDACALRAVCHEALAAVRDFHWSDARTSIRGALPLWRASFPHARAANVSGRSDLTDDDMSSLAGVSAVFAMSCVGLTDAGFSHLAACRTLDMSHCNQNGITNAAFAALSGVRALNMSGCNQAGITDAAFVHLTELRSLGIAQSTFGLYPRLQLTDRAFTHLRKLESLCASGLDSITDAALAHLDCLRNLSIAYCDQAGISDAAFVNLRDLEVLDIRNCSQLTDAALSPLTKIRSVDMRGCEKITADCARDLASRVDCLFVADCSESVRAAAKEAGGARVFL